MKKEFFHAVLSDDFDKVKSLLDDGVSVNERIDREFNEIGIEYLDLTNEAKRSQYSASLPWLLGNFQLPKMTALILAVNEGSAEIVRLLLDKEADVNTRIRANNSKYYITPLLLATYLGNAEIVRMLIEHGADIHESVTTRDLGGKTALRIAVKKEDIEIVQLLLQAGAMY